MPAQTAPSSDNLLLGKGQLFFDRFDANGARTGLRHLGNVETLEITTNDDRIQKYSSMSAAAPLYKEVNRRRTVSLKIVGEELNSDNLALALMGSVSILVQAATAVVAEAIFASTIPGTYFKLSKMGPYTGVAIKFGAGAGVLGTDYEVIDAKLGIYHILAGTVLTGAVTADYTPTAYAGTAGPKVVGGGTAAVITGYMLFQGDPSAGPKVMCEIWKVSMSPDSAVGLIGDDFAALGLNANVLDDTVNHAANPLYQVTYSP